MSADDLVQTIWAQAIPWSAQHGGEAVPLGLLGRFARFQAGKLREIELESARNDRLDERRAAMRAARRAAGAAEGHRRDHARARAVPLDDELDAADCGLATPDSELVVHDLLSRLRPDRAKIVRDVVLDGATGVEVAQADGVSKQAAHRRLQSAMRDLRQLLAE